MRFLNSAFNGLPGVSQYDFYPADLQGKIDEVNEWVYNDINNGVYKCGFAKSQAAYDEAAERLFAGLDRVEEILSKQRFVSDAGRRTVGSNDHILGIL